MVKMKLERTADCVIGGFRRNGNGEVSTLLLGLYDDEGLLDFVGTTEALPEEARAGIEKLVTPLVEPPGFTGRMPGPEGRATKPRDFEPLKAALVCEVKFDRFSVDRFRTAPTFMRFRPDKKPKACTYDQVRPAADEGRGLELIGL
jgi:ATP-dependent DNA ligase